MVVVAVVVVHLPPSTDPIAGFAGGPCIVPVPAACAPIDSDVVSLTLVAVTHVLPAPNGSSGSGFSRRDAGVSHRE